VGLFGPLSCLDLRLLSRLELKVRTLPLSFCLSLSLVSLSLPLVTDCLYRFGHDIRSVSVCSGLLLRSVVLRSSRFSIYYHTIPFFNFDFPPLEARA